MTVLPMATCPMPRNGYRHRFTGGWAPADAGGVAGQTCFLCHQVWITQPDGSLARFYAEPC